MEFPRILKKALPFLTRSGGITLVCRSKHTRTPQFGGTSSPNLTAILKKCILSFPPYILLFHSDPCKRPTLWFRKKNKESLELLIALHGVNKKP